MPKANSYQPNSYTRTKPPSYDVDVIADMVNSVVAYASYLTDKERKFLLETSERLDQYRQHTRFTDPQIDWITRLYMDRVNRFNKQSVSDDDCPF